MQDVLGSWKEIANYLGKGVRTVQRWERQWELPVHRPSGSSKGVVIAFPPELEKWTRRQDGTEPRNMEIHDGERQNTAAMVRRNTALTRELAERTRLLLGHTEELMKSCSYFLERSRCRRSDIGADIAMPASDTPVSESSAAD
jgi:hypothetical protein